MPENESTDPFEGVDPGWVTATDAMDSVLASKLSDSELWELAHEIVYMLENNKKRDN